MTTSLAPDASASTGTADSASASTASSGIRRLNPADGLFLRSEHLNQMQSYSRELALAVGIAAGTGVCYGYQLSLSGSTLLATPGLAVDAAGLPLRTGEQVSVELDGLATPAGRFWLVEVIADQPVPSDNEPVYGNLCGDPCSGSSIQPWLDNAVRIQVSARDTLPGLASVSTPGLARNWLASAYFEQERRSGPPWLTPDQSGLVGSIQQLPWSDGQPATGVGPLGDPAPNGVPLGVLLRVDGEWLLDVWTGRRDLDQPPPRAAWECRLGLRPWPVFVAQVLQFQAQLAELPTGQTLGDTELGDAKDFYEVVLKQNPRSRKAMQELWDDWEKQHAKPLATGSLLSHGFAELPPAGFLPQPSAQVTLAEVQAIFGPNVLVRLKHNSADAALRAVTEAQQLDRIPLDRPSAKPVVDVWVPDTAADLPAVFTPSYGWIAFARDRSEPVTVTEPTTDQVEVYLMAADGDEPFDHVLTRFSPEKLTAADRLATLQYPSAEWGVPTPEATVVELGKKFTELMLQTKRQLIGVIGTARSDPRRPLVAARAVLLPVGWSDSSLVELTTTAVVQHAEPELIVLVVGSVRQQPGQG